MSILGFDEHVLAAFLKHAGRIDGSVLARSRRFGMTTAGIHPRMFSWAII